MHLGLKHFIHQLGSFLYAKSHIHISRSLLLKNKSEIAQASAATQAHYGTLWTGNMKSLHNARNSKELDSNFNSGFFKYLLVLRNKKIYNNTTVLSVLNNS